MKERYLITVLLAFAISVSSLAQQPAATPSQSPSPGSAPQQTAPGDDDVVRISANLVQVDAVVTDKNGKQVTDLSDQDFEVLEDKRPQKISNLSYISIKSEPGSTQPRGASTKDKTALPPVHLRPEQVRRTIALVVDDLGLSFESVAYVRQALKKFVDQQMESGDLAAIIRTSAGSGALQQFTADKRLLYAAIERLRWYPFGRGPIGSFAPIELDPLAKLGVRAAQSLPANASAPATFGAGGDADLEQFRRDVFSVGTLGALKYVVQGMGALPGRKSVVLMSDGISIFKPVSRTSGESGAAARRNRDQEATGVLDSLRQLTDFANRASVVIYTMDARGLQALGFSAADNTNDISGEQLEGRLSDRHSQFFASQDGLNYLAQQTGGYFIHDRNDLAGGIAKILEDQKGYYLIGYRPDDSTFDAKGRRSFHHLVVRVKRPGLKVRARTGFFGVTDEEIRAAPRTGQQQLLGALISPFSAADVHLRLTSLFGTDAHTGSVMRALLHIDGRDLTFTDAPDGWHQVSFEILAVAFGDAGVLAEKFGRIETLRVREDAYRQAQQQGLIYKVNLPIQKAGAYQLRIAVRDIGSQRVGAASQFVEVPDLKKGRLALSGIVVAGRDPVAMTPRPATVSNGISPAPAGYGKNAGSEAELDPQASPAVRRLRPGMVLNYAYSIYNAKRDKQTHRPQLQTRVRLFRDDQLVYTGKVLAFDIGQQTDIEKLAALGTLQLSAKEKPGDYFLEVVVTDLLADKNHNTTTSWIDFEILQ
ncbi:MAG TPA: VWA domain-containing protein [Pyrinomonadaceae bacterium]|nr:VWA domain-containing protein [Pyrinomonadaceae bacterium]